MTIPIDLDDVTVPGFDPKNMSYEQVANELYRNCKTDPFDQYIVSFWAGVACAKLMEAQKTADADRRKHPRT